eukprot:3820101-Prymnesium_polylepis.1
MSILEVQVPKPGKGVPLGLDIVNLRIHNLTRGAAARNSGLREGDKLLSVDSVAVHSDKTFLSLVRLRSGAPEWTFRIERGAALHDDDDDAKSAFFVPLPNTQRKPINPDFESEVAAVTPFNCSQKPNIQSAPAPPAEAPGAKPAAGLAAVPEDESGLAFDVVCLSDEREALEKEVASLKAQRSE